MYMLASFLLKGVCVLFFSEIRMRCNIDHVNLLLVQMFTVFVIMQGGEKCKAEQALK